MFDFNSLMDFSHLSEPANYVNDWGMPDGPQPYNGGGFSGIPSGGGGGGGFNWPQFIDRTGDVAGGIAKNLAPSFGALATGLVGKALFPDQPGKSKTKDLRTPEQQQAEQQRLNQATLSGQKLQQAEADPYYGTLGPEATDIRTRRLRQQMMDTAGAAGQGAWSGTGDRINTKLTEDLSMQNQQREEALNRLRSQFATMTGGYQSGYAQQGAGRPNGYGQIFGQTIVPGIGDSVADLLGVRRPGQRTIKINGQDVTVG